MGSAGWPPSLACCQHTHHRSTEPRGTTGVRQNHTRTGSRRHNGRSAEPHPHAITPARRTFGGTTRRTRSHGSTTGHPHHGRSNHACTTRFPHHGRSNHACTTRFPHHEHSYHASTTRTRTTGTGTTGVHESRRMTRKRRADHAPQPPNGLPISRRKRTAATVKMPMISCAQRSAAWACSAAAIQVASLVEYP